MGVRQILLAILLVAATVAAAAAGAEDSMVVQAAAGVVAKAQAGSTLCCTNMTGYHECIVACFDYYPREQAEKICDPGCQEAYQCRATTGDKCPSVQQPSSDLLANPGEVRAVTTTTLCCSNMTGFHECVEDCFAYFPREQAEKICDPGCKEAYQCRAVSGDKCPSSEHSSSGSVGRDVQAVTTTLCCSNMTGFHECVEDCFGYFPREQAEKICDPGCKEAYQCRAVSGDKCPSEHRSSNSGEVQAVTTTLCCSNMTGFHECVEDCFGYFPREQAEKICDPGCQEAYQCRAVSGDKCPSGSHSSDRITNSAEGDAVEKCVSGCKSSVCSKMVAGVGSKLFAVKHAVKRCNNTCYKFCVKGLRVGTATA